ncbi:MAG: diacylglycerol kinase family lipid kinase [Acidobacteria bacterium]|nr:diacylglycerol kinase family lipid kinase [Acidobacteriota bacterium]
MNPRAGLLARSRAMQRVAATLDELGWDVEARETAARGDATALAREAVARGLDAVLVAGGDGTVNETIQGLVGSDVALGALPLGTMNVWVRELGLSLDPVEAVRQLATGEVRRIDLGRANGRYFLLMAGLGLDAEAVLAVDGTHKRRFGPVAIIVAGLFVGLSKSGSRLRVRIDGHSSERRAALVTIGNTRLWAGTVQITNRASASDGLLDVCFFPGRTWLARVRHFALVMIRRHEDDPEVTYLRAREIQISARPTLPLQVDGESHGTTPARIGIVPGALRVLVGHKAPPALVDAPVEPLHLVRATL